MLMSDFSSKLKETLVYSLIVTLKQTLRQKMVWKRDNIQPVVVLSENAVLMIVDYF